jgi:hypothetical protein
VIAIAVTTATAALTTTTITNAAITTAMTKIESEEAETTINSCYNNNNCTEAMTRSATMTTTAA